MERFEILAANFGLNKPAKIGANRHRISVESGR
jgi:hypothetical protein